MGRNLSRVGPNLSRVGPNLSRVGPNLSWPYGRSRVPIENRTEGLLGYWTESLGKEDLACSTAEGVGGLCRVWLAASLFQYHFDTCKTAAWLGVEMLGAFPRISWESFSHMSHFYSGHQGCRLRDMLM